MTNDEAVQLADVALASLRHIHEQLAKNVIVNQPGLASRRLGPALERMELFRAHVRAIKPEPRPTCATCQHWCPRVDKADYCDHPEHGRHCAFSDYFCADHESL